MKTNYLQRNSQLGVKGNAPSVIRAFVTAAIICLFFVILRMFFAPFFTQMFTVIAGPSWNTRNAISQNTTGALAYVEPRSILIAQIHTLETEVNDLRARNSELETRVQTLSDSDLQSLLGDSTRIIAPVISRPPYTPFDSIVISKGTNAGIAEGDKVYSSAGISVGLVTVVSGSSSHIFLYSSGGTATQAINARTTETVTLRGIGGGNFDISVPKDFNIEVGDTLTDSGPHRALIAKVYAIDSTSSDSFKKVSARIPKNILTLQWVGIEKEESGVQ